MYLVRTLEIINDTTLKIQPPPHDTAELVDVTISDGNTSVTAETQFKYNAPIVNSVSPTSGPTDGGNDVTIHGEFLEKIISVKFGGVAAHIEHVDKHYITVDAPAHCGETIDIVLSDGVVTVSLPNSYEYIGAACTGPSTSGGGGDSEGEIVEEVILGTLSLIGLTSLYYTSAAAAPSIGDRDGGTEVTISGNDFMPGKTLVYFGKTKATDIQVFDKNTLIAKAPAGHGEVKIKVLTPTGEQVVEKEFKYG